MPNTANSRVVQTGDADPKALFAEEHDDEKHAATDAHPQFLKTIQLKSEPELSYWTLFTRYIFWPFVQGVMIGLGQYGTKYIIHHYFERKPIAAKTEEVARQRS